MNLLLLSNSTNYGEPYMQWCSSTITSFVKDHSSIIFIPYAGVGFTYDEYTQKVNYALSSFDVKVSNLDNFDDKAKALKDSSAIFVGGGNTFHLLKMLQQFDLLETIQKVVANGKPYVGWSAGSNIASPTIRTTNDMPIVEPKSFQSLSLVPFQINPHYTEKSIPNHGGESRLQRLREFLAANPHQKVIALPESSYLVCNGNQLIYNGRFDGKVITSSGIKAINDQSNVIF
ncbi:MAG: dipeptidase PepE [Bacteroidia bacterium]|nr:dipeptidase PepE [Bacteroidia bacterium]MDG2041463.1 dipeptidase PepE [Bacteroidia bacterium]